MSLKSLNTTSPFYAASLEPISQEAEHELQMEIQKLARKQLVDESSPITIKMVAKEM